SPIHSSVDAGLAPQAPEVSSNDAIPGELRGEDELRWWDAHHSPFQASIGWQWMQQTGGLVAHVKVQAARQAYSRLLGGLDHQPTPRDKVELMARAMGSVMQPDDVCRHYAHTFVLIAESLGLHAEYRAYAWGIGESRGHCWNRISI